MTPARTVFLGSGSFAVPILEMLAEHPRIDLRAVVTAPPRAIGRGQRIVPSVVGSRAASMPLPVLTPERLRAPDTIDQLRSLRPDLIILADYGQIVPRSLLELPPHGALNLHPSLLPRHRGATPIPAAILAGDRMTGVSLMRMDEGLDTGPLIAVREVPLSGDETTPVLVTALARVAAELLARCLPLWLAGDLAATRQVKEGASLSRPLRRQDGRLDPNRPATSLERQIRAYQPWPGSFLETEEGRLVAWQGRVRDAAGQTAGSEHGVVDAPPGMLVAAGEGLGLVTADGILELVEVQPAGGRRMRGSEYARGRPGVVGSRVREVTLR
ncbi:MAG: methionyl-tRNA formyltransferase [Chloroflexota bacterium]|nr:methionyl-tRNA formyltransferase [Chloroflexota bacterium]